MLLQTAQGGDIKLTSTPDADFTLHNANGVKYQYWGSLPAAHQWVVQAWYWEPAGTVLVDQRTGRRLELLGSPSASPDGRYLLSVREDMAGGGITHLALYACGPTPPQLVWARDLERWGPRAARWRDARHVLLQQAQADPTGDVATAASRIKLTYAELELGTRP